MSVPDAALRSPCAPDVAPCDACAPGSRQRATRVSTQEAVAVAALYHDDFECLGYPKPTI